MARWIHRSAFVCPRQTAGSATQYNCSIAIKERLKIKIEGSFTDLPDHTNNADPILNPANSSFGKVPAERGEEFGGHRTSQVGTRIEFRS